MQCTPSMAKMLLMDTESSNAIKKLEYMLIGGEAFPVNLADQLTEIVEGTVLNMYGPTETTIWSSVHKVDSIEDTIPIGKPISNTDIFILDSHNQLTPIGVPGELCIGGEGVVRGYLDRPELTSERFIQVNLNGKERSQRLYKTGDLVRYRKDGVLEFLGRLDHQVKIRGYRIELGEIETALEKYGQIREAVVIAREDTLGDKKLVAYIIAIAGAVPSIFELRNYLKDILPEYMVPAMFVVMKELPLTPNGKVDRKALPAPDSERLDLNAEFMEPRTQTEKTLGEIWSSVLGIEKIGVRDNFFELGGHSLSAVQITAKIHQLFNVDLSLQTFFQSSTLEDLASAVEEKLLEQTSGDDLEQLLKEIENSK
jgi:acyl-CoA synthetase (AMP-forming)/AMP-acid ligase II/acyl carrier protein